MTSDSSVSRPTAAARLRHRCAKISVAIILSFVPLSLTGCGGAQQVGPALSAVPHIDVIEVRTASVLPLISLDFHLDLRLESGADLPEACQAVLNTMGMFTNGGNRTVQSLTIRQEVGGIETVTDGCEKYFVDSVLTAQQAMIPHLSSGTELWIDRGTKTSTSVSVDVKGGPADTHALDAIRAVVDSDVTVSDAYVLPDTDERWFFESHRIEDTITCLDALLAVDVVPIEVSFHDFVPLMFIQVSPNDLETATSVALPDNLHDVEISDVTFADWNASPTPSPTT